MTERLSPGDPSSFSRPDLVRSTHLHLSLNVDFVRKVLHGSVKLKAKKIDVTATELILDIKEIKIYNIHETSTGQNLKYEIGKTFGDVGTKLTINVSECPQEFELLINYETSPTACGLQWLSPKQTSGKIHPFMFSQGQPIEMRSIVPCQDTPSVKIPYSADIRAPKELTVLMSALKVQNPVELPDNTKLHIYNQPVPMPTYLIAIAVGELECRTLSSRCEVWAEKELIDKAANEFAETDQMLQIAESICGPYVWKMYGVLVLPPSFPYGGMENPCLTFVTPTVLAGDRSLADVIAHEIAHSWTGNLVTNTNFEHFWLNEGFTTFVERKILGNMKGLKHRDLVTLVGYTEIQDTIMEMGENNVLTKLVVDLTGLHPDEAFSKVPYEKGSLFLRYIEQCVGGLNEFEGFLKHYINHYQYKSITTDDFKNLFLQYFPNEEIKNKINWDHWLYEPGMPKQIPELDKSLLENIESMTKQWIEFNNNETMSLTSVPQDLSTLSTTQITQFLNQLIEKDPLSIRTLTAMNDLYKLDKIENAEIKSRWLRLCLRGKWQDKIPAAFEFVNSMGRMKYLFPIYRELYKIEHIRKDVIENFMTHKDEMMLVAQKGIVRILQLPKNSIQ